MFGPEVAQDSNAYILKVLFEVLLLSLGFPLSHLVGKLEGLDFALVSSELDRELVLTQQLFHVHPSLLVTAGFELFFRLVAVDHVDLRVNDCCGLMVLVECEAHHEKFLLDFRLIDFQKLLHPFVN